MGHESVDTTMEYIIPDDKADLMDIPSNLSFLQKKVSDEQGFKGSKIRPKWKSKYFDLKAKNETLENQL